MRERIPLGVASDAEYDMDELTADQRRAARAVTDHMIVVPRVDGRGRAEETYDVLSSSRHAYATNPFEGDCNCPDQVHNQPGGYGCKHLRRIRLLENLPDVPFPIPGDDVSEYAWLLNEQLKTMVARRDLLETQVFDADDDADVDVRPSAPTEEYRTVDWFVRELSDHEVLHHL